MKILTEVNKILFDGTLFSENQMMGKNRSGLGRVAEEVAIELVKTKNFEFFFANFLYLQNYHDKLKQYIEENHSTLIKNLVSKRPLPVLEFLKFNGIWTKYPKTMVLPVKTQPLNQFNLFHSFYYPYNNTVLKSSIKKCITFYDIIPIVMNRSQRFIKERTERIVKDIEKSYAISISEFSKNDLLNYNSKIDPDKIFVSPLAASKNSFYRNTNEEDWSRVKLKYNLPENYFFCVAANDPRKNIKHVIKSFEKFILQERKDIYLVLAGNSSHGQKLISELSLNKKTISRIIAPSRYIDEKDLASIYSKAFAFIYMSEYEGFGLPPLEAMQCGTPTISSNCTSIPEVVGNAGILISPYDEDLLAEKMLLLYNNDELREKLSINGINRAAEFSWERTAKEYNQIFDYIITQN